MASNETFVTVPETGAWRVSDLEGKAVYGSDGANIGDINDVLVSQDGSVNAVIIGVGGFLGIGEKDVAVNMSALQLGPGDTQAQANAASSALPDPTGATGAVSGDAMPGQGVTDMDSPGVTTNATGDMAANTAGTGATIGDDGLPDRIILNVTREQLEQAPAFEGVEASQP
nr:PRC-barrel domain-containing protein [Pleomorphomonas sp. NRK KF1]